ncbi:hypothetical protein F4804DRAFT_339427 [Jackrogersella minutella]|nr:hypothetical protein F4804DRAFT_339427 [Jackrogersella minutella]
MRRITPKFTPSASPKAPSSPREGQSTTPPSQPTHSGNSGIEQPAPKPAPKPAAPEPSANRPISSDLPCVLPTPCDPSDPRVKITHFENPAPATDTELSNKGYKPPRRDQGEFGQKSAQGPSLYPAEGSPLPPPSDYGPPPTLKPTLQPDNWNGYHDHSGRPDDQTQSYGHRPQTLANLTKMHNKRAIQARRRQTQHHRRRDKVLQGLISQGRRPRPNCLLRREIGNIRWIHGEDDPADAMTKSNANKAFKTFVDNYCITLRLHGWVKRDNYTTPSLRSPNSSSTSV